MSFTYKEKKLIAAHLNKIVAGKIKPLDTELGICYEIKILTNGRRGTYLNLQSYFPTWKHFSGNLNYPIPDPLNTKTPTYMFNSISNLWDKTTAYGKLRYNLAKHIAKEMNRENREERAKQQAKKGAK